MTLAQEQSRKLLMHYHVHGSLVLYHAQIIGSFPNPKTLHNGCLFVFSGYFQIIKSINKEQDSLCICYCYFKCNMIKMLIKSHKPLLS